MRAYEAIITPFADGDGNGSGISASNHSAFGTVAVLAIEKGSKGAIFFGGALSNLKPNLDGETDDCSAKNACGVHLHSGRSCADVMSQEGHYFDTSMFEMYEDPWAKEKYSSDDNGDAVFDGIVNIGHSYARDLDGRAFVVHADDGSRIGCGTLAEAPLLVSSLSGFKQEGEVFAVESGEDTVCFVGTASGLTPNAECKPDAVPNSCGVHVHEGSGCENKAAQGNHWYNPSSFDEDPWRSVGYESTDEIGKAVFSRCVKTGYPSSMSVQSKAFIVHEFDGSRAICGKLELYSEKGNARKVAMLSAVCMALLCIAVGYLKLCRKERQERSHDNTTDLELTQDSVKYRDDDPMEKSIEQFRDDQDEPEHEMI
mmetsp:Transcript_22560/g.53255  ORF Transcript_22560/g.53255 Transcript_22560/m.53255 type:complete len:370 (+) Transcript_22560:89-1198(+)